MVGLRDGYGHVAARRVRKIAERKGHFLGKFHASKDNADENKLGDTFYATCRFCERLVLIHFEPFDTKEDEARAVTVVSNRWGHESKIRYVVNGMIHEKCKHRSLSRGPQK